MEVSPGATFTTSTSPIDAGLVGIIGYRVLTVADGTLSARVTNTVTEVALGDDLSVYYADGTAPSVDGEYVIIWDTGDGRYAPEDLTVSSFNATDPLASIVPGSYGPGTAGAALGTLGDSIIHVTAPDHQIGKDIFIFTADDYNVSEFRQFEWTNTDWPNLVGATATIYMSHKTVANKQTFAGTVETLNKVRLQLTDDQTAALKQGIYRYSVEVVLANSHKITLLLGTAVVRNSP